MLTINSVFCSTDLLLRINRHTWFINDWDIYLSTTAIYSGWKTWPQNCHRLQFCPHFYLWIKTANGCSSMASQQNCKRLQFCGQFSEFMAYVSTKLQTLAVLWPLFGVYRMLSPPELQTLAVLWPLFGVYIKVAIKLLTMAVLWPQHSKLSFHHKTARVCSFVVKRWFWIMWP